MQPSIGLIETNSIAKGIEASDAMMKTSGVELVDAYAICPGKYLVLITGSLSDVQSSMKAGAEMSSGTLIDQMLIPNVSAKIVPAILGTSDVSDLEAVGVLETFTVASCILAADAAAKAASVELIEIRLAKGLGGKSFFTMTGEVGAVRSAMNAAVKEIKDEGVIVQKVVIPQAHKELRRTLL
jgi:microcompartment protein CcmL/EutN